MFRLVIIDDEFLVLKHMTTIIDWNMYGYELVGAFDDSTEGLQYIATHNVDLILTDIKMQNITGVDIAKFCEKLVLPPKIIFISAYRDFDYAQAAIKLNVIDYILKPISKNKIISALGLAFKQLTRNNFMNFQSPDIVFSAKNEINDVKRLYTDLVIGNISEVFELSEYGKKIGYGDEIAELPYVVFDMIVENYEIYMSRIWKYEPERFILAINSIIFHIQKDMVFAVVSHENHMIKIFGFSKIANPDWNAAMDKIKECLNDIIMLEITVENLECSAKMSDLICAKNVQDKKFDGIVRDVKQYIEKNYKKNIPLDDICNYVSLSRAYFCVCYKKYAGESFTQTLNSYRIEKAKQLIDSKEESKFSLLHLLVGFRSKSYFYKVFKESTGMTPWEYRQRGESDWQNTQS